MFNSFAERAKTFYYRVKQSELELFLLVVGRW
jgi:hypothetical protein